MSQYRKIPQAEKFFDLPAEDQRKLLLKQLAELTAQLKLTQLSLQPDRLTIFVNELESLAAFYENSIGQKNFEVIKNLSRQISGLAQKDWLTPEDLTELQQALDNVGVLFASTENYDQKTVPALKILPKEKVLVPNGSHREAFLQDKPITDPGLLEEIEILKKQYLVEVSVFNNPIIASIGRERNFFSPEQTEKSLKTRLETFKIELDKYPPKLLSASRPLRAIRIYLAKKGPEEHNLGKVNNQGELLFNSYYEHTTAAIHYAIFYNLARRQQLQPGTEWENIPEDVKDYIDNDQHFEKVKKKFEDYHPKQAVNNLLRLRATIAANLMMRSSGAIETVLSPKLERAVKDCKEYFEEITEGKMNKDSWGNRSYPLT